MKAIFAGENPSPGQRVNTLYVWVGIHADGGEGILSCDLPMFGGIRHSPLLSSQKGVAELGEVMAKRIQAEAAAAGTTIQIELRTFVSLEFVAAS